MRTAAVLLVPAALVVISACSSTPTPAPATTPAPAAATAAAGRGAAPAGGAAQAPAGGRAGAPGAAAAPGAGGGGRQGAPQLTLEQRQARVDSIAAARTEYARQVMATIAGKENLPAGEVFKNVQLMKTVPAGQFIAAMDQGIGRGTGKGCNDCHVTTDWASDTLARKKTARTMMGVVNDINGTLLPRMGPGRGGAPRTIQCLTCHRGGQAGRNVTIP